MGRPSLQLVLVSIVTAATYLFMYFVIGPRLPVTTSDVPALDGLAIDQARGLLETRALVLVLDGERPDSKAPAGTLTHQTPLGGSRIHRGGEVHAFVAVAALPTVPKLVGMTSAEAQNELGDVKLSAGKISDSPSDSVLKGQVIASSPPFGTQLAAGAPVDLVVSLGPSAPKAAAVPQVVGKKLAKAREALEQAGFAVGTTHFGSNDDFDQGVVIKQSPTGNAAAAAGARVDLVVND